MSVIELTCLPNAEMRAQGHAILRVAADLRNLIDGEDVPDSLREDIETIERAGQWLARASSVTIPPGGLRSVGIPTAGHAATGFTA